MTLIIIFLISVLSTYVILTLIAALLNGKIKDFFDDIEMPKTEQQETLI